MSGAKQLLEEIEDIERRMADPATVELLGEDLGTMQLARAQMIGRLNEMNAEHRPFTANTQAQMFRDSAHSAGVEAAGVRGPVLFGLGGDRAASSALARDGETVDEDHLQDLAELYGPESAQNVRETVQQLEAIEGIKADSLSGRLAGDAGGLRAGEDPADFAHRVTSR